MIRRCLPVHLPPLGARAGRRGWGAAGGVNSAEPGTEMNGSEGPSLDPLPSFQKDQAGSRPAVSPLSPQHRAWSHKIATRVIGRP